MAGNTTALSVLTRSKIWSSQIKETLKDELNAQKYVNWIDFPDGNNWTIPSIGDLDAYDYTEDTAIEYTPLDVGEFTFNITNYKASATYITEKARQDLFYASQLEAKFVPAENRAISVAVETDILKQGQPGTPNGQTASSANRINNADHRWVGSDTANSVPAIGFKDFAKARYSLTKANVGNTGLYAIVDPSSAYHFNTLTGVLDITYKPRWEGIVSEGVDSGMAFKFNIFGFDIYESNYLYSTTASETINSVTAASGSIANLFFSTSVEKPWIGAWRQMPKVDGEYNKDFQREEYVTTARWGVKLYRPENFITVLSSPNIIV